MKDDGWWQELSPTQIRWIRHELELDEPVDSPSGRVTLLRRLETNGFLPAPGTHIAIELALASAEAGRAPLPLHKAADAYQGSLEAELRSEVDKLRENILKLPVTERQKQWQHLSQSCREFPALAEQLKHLERGIFAVSSPQIKQDPALDQLSLQVAKVFRLPFAERGLRRRQALHKDKPVLNAWEKASHQLADTYPKLAELDPRFLYELSLLRRQRTPLTKARKLARTQAPVKAGSGGNYSWAWALGFGMLMIGRLITSLTNSNTRHNSAPVYPPSPLKVSSGNNAFVPAKLSKEEVRQQIEYHRADKLRKQLAASGVPGNKLPPLPPTNGFYGESFLKLFYNIPDEALDPSKPIPLAIQKQYWPAFEIVSPPPATVPRFDQPDTDNPDYQRGLETMRKLLERRQREGNSSSTDDCP